MKRIGFLMRGFFLLMLGAGGSVFLAGPAWAALGPNLATNSDYAASPVFVSWGSGHTVALRRSLRTM